MGELENCVEDICNCSICNSIFTSPKTLPCLHTFCQDCLQNYIDLSECELNCPICRSIFNLKDSNCANLPNNFFIAKLCEAKILNQIKIVDKTDLCNNHNKIMDMYCSTCNIPICNSCLIRDHLKHDLEDVQEAIKKINQLKSELIIEADKKIRKKQLEKSEIDNELESLITSFKTNELLIKKAADALKIQIDVHSKNLISNLLRKIDINKGEVLNKGLTLLDDIKIIQKHVSAISHQINVTDILEVQDRIKNLNSILLESKDLQNMPSIKINILFSKNFKELSENQIGNIIDVKEYHLNNFSTYFCILSNLIITKDFFNNFQLNILDINTLAETPYIVIDKVKMKGSLKQIISVYKSIYLNFSDAMNNKVVNYIYRYDISSNNLTLHLQFPIDCRIAESGFGNLLVTTYDLQITEYASNLKKLRIITVPKEARISQVFHIEPAYLLNNEKYLIATYDNTSVLITLVNSYGVYKSFTKESKSNICIATDYEKYIFILEAITGPLTIMNTELQIIREMTIKYCIGLVFNRAANNIMLYNDTKINVVDCNF